ncbi:C45 family autoproteolytic acyltransferase/hydolase [Rufibacter psychrotolerans]|uniref:C45 family autoproteolytic acyltransferase/hydolase n=1 Tax=Rufibacter psychrotolerans TaxID=2812556 RepID=UPI00196749C2|nr:C45 family peptidase [Rufibacter sp. SYSU D00308]
MKQKFLLLLTLLSFFLQPAWARSNAGKVPRVPVVELKGSAYERGLQHGQQLRQPIAEVYQKWKASVRLETNRHPDSVIAHFLSTSNYKAAIQQWTPELWQEIEGMAAGSGQKLDDVFAFQLIDEYWGYLDRLKHGSVDKDHCSAVGVAAHTGQPTYIAQNVDIDTFMHGYQVLLHINQTPTTPEQYILTCAGFIGFVGMNNQGVGVVINALTDLRNRVDGLPVTFVTRGLLSKKSGKEALAFLQTVPHATGQNYILGTETAVHNLEASANQVVPFFPAEDKKLVYHTNHALANHDVKPWMQQYHQRMLTGTGPKTNSQTRFAALEQRLKLAQQPLSPALVKATLRSKDHDKFPVCVTYNKDAAGFTFSSVLFTFGKKPSVQVTHGSPDQSEYQEHFFTAKK